VARSSAGPQQTVTPHASRSHVSRPLSLCPCPLLLCRSLNPLTARRNRREDNLSCKGILSGYTSLREKDIETRHRHRPPTKTVGVSVRAPENRENFLQVDLPSSTHKRLNVSQLGSRDGSLRPRGLCRSLSRRCLRLPTGVTEGGEVVFSWTAGSGQDTQCPAAPTHRG